MNVRITDAGSPHVLPAIQRVEVRVRTVLIDHQPRYVVVHVESEAAILQERMDLQPVPGILVPMLLSTGGQVLCGQERELSALFGNARITMDPFGAGGSLS